MKSIQKNYQFRFTFLIALTILCSPCLLKAQASAASSAPLPAVGTSSVLGKLNGVEIAVMVQSPSAAVTPLQIVCVFEHEDGDDFNSPTALPPGVNGMYQVDKHLHGLITDLRKSGKFYGRALETLLITPPKGTIPAQRLLLIGLGSKKDFTPDLMIAVGRTGMREALRLGVGSYAHASDLKDGGLDSPTALIITNVLKGAMEAYETELYLQGKQAATFKPLTRITLLAGQPFYTPSGEAAKQFIQNYQH